MSKYCTTSIPQNSLPRRRLGQKLFTAQETFPKQLELFPTLPKCQTPQISSIPGTHPLQGNRYQVTLGGKAIATGLDAPDAREFAKLIKRKRFTQAIEFLEARGIFTEQAQLFLLSAIGGGR